MFLIFAVLALFAAAEVQSYAIDSYNVITVPPNCPAGQEWINGECREIWALITYYWRSVDTPNYALSSSYMNTQNEYYNLLIRVSTYNAVTVPTNCPKGQEYVNGQCRDIWMRRSEVKRETEEDNEQKAGERNIITVPNQCPIGYKPDALGYCREVFH